MGQQRKNATRSISNYHAAVKGTGALLEQKDGIPLQAFQIRAPGKVHSIERSTWQEAMARVSCRFSGLARVFTGWCIAGQP